MLRAVEVMTDPPLLLPGADVVLEEPVIMVEVRVEEVPDTPGGLVVANNDVVGITGIEVER